MQNLLKCFEYLKPYHIDMLDAIGVMIELFLLKSLKRESFFEILPLDKARAYDKLTSELKSIIDPALFIAPSPKINTSKILKLIAQDEFSNSDIEQFLHIITQKKTTNKLYFYSTPCEINQLLVGILDIKENDEIYNPCYGMGSVFLSIASITPRVSLYGEELDSKLSSIAKLIAKLSGLKESHLCVSDILANPMFKENGEYIKFDKILCNPPLNAHLGTELLKDDERFSKVGILIKTYPELVFLMHSLAHLKDKGVFIVRNQTLQKSSLEGKLRERLCEEGMIEAVIELPKNIFPHQSHDFSLLVISHGNKEILHINANHEHFYAKDGKYNRLINVEEILQIYRTKNADKSASKYASLTPLSEVSTQDLRAHIYTTNLLESTIAPSNASSNTLESLGVEIFRGQRIYGTRKDEMIEFFDIGIADFAPCGYTQSFQTKKLQGNREKIEKYQVRSFDILLSLRGVTPKLTILGKIDSISVVNSGIIVLRAPSQKVAVGLYCYLFSLAGEEALAKIYKESSDGALNIENLSQLTIPHDYAKNAAQTIENLNNLRDDIYKTQDKINKIKQDYQNG